MMAIILAIIMVLPRRPFFQKLSQYKPNSNVIVIVGEDVFETVVPTLQA
jgi:hypothetical protein